MTRAIKIPKGGREDFYPRKSLHKGGGSIHGRVHVHVGNSFFRQIYTFISPMIIFMSAEIINFLKRGGKHRFEGNFFFIFCIKERKWFETM